MIIVTGKLQISPDARDALVDALGPLVAGTHAEDGCVRYDFAFDSQDPAVVHLVEVWESREALQAHFTTPHFAEFGKRLPEFVSGRAEIATYEGEPVDLGLG